MIGASSLVFVSVFNRGAKELAANHLASLNRYGCGNYRSYCTDPVWSTAASDDPGRKHIYLDADAIAELLNNNSTAAAAPQQQRLLVHYTSAKADIGTREFNLLSYLRYYVILAELKAGNDVWYLDVDTVVRTNLNVFWAEQRRKRPTTMLFQDDLNMACTGCMLIPACTESVRMITDFIAFFTTTTSGGGASHANDQIAMADFLAQRQQQQQQQQQPSNTEDEDGGGRRHSSVQLLDRMRFPCGRIFFGNEFVPLSGAEAAERTQCIIRGVRDTAWFVHANYMVGVDTKVRAMKASGLWYGP